MIAKLPAVEAIRARIGLVVPGINTIMEPWAARVLPTGVTLHAARMLLQVHDELIFECPKAEAEETSAVVKGVMEKAYLPAVEISVPLVVDARAGKNWDEAH